MRTLAQKWRRERNLTIAAAASVGVSQAMLARVFSIARSRITTILAELARENAENVKRDAHQTPERPRIALLSRARRYRNVAHDRDPGRHTDDSTD